MAAAAIWDFYSVEILTIRRVKRVKVRQLVFFDYVFSISFSLMFNLSITFR